MQLFRFDAHAGRPVSAFGSQSAAIAHIVRAGTACSAVAIHLEPGGVLGAHPATEDQLFLVVAGSGRVSGKEGLWRDAVPGCAALWRAREVHETRAGAEGLTALVLEGNNLADAIVLQPWEG